MKYLIELPDVLKDEKGNEYEPTGEFRVPVKDDVCLDKLLTFPLTTTS